MTARSITTLLICFVALHCAAQKRSTTTKALKTSGTLAITPNAYAFPGVSVGSSLTTSAALSASGAAVYVKGASISNSAFSLSGITFPVKIAAGQSVNLNVTFKPTAATAYSGSIKFSCNATTCPVMSVSGSGTGTVALAASPSTFNFGNVPLNTASSQTGSIQASNGTVTVSSDTLSGTGFSISGLTLPVTLAAGQSASFTVTFDPTVAGSASGSLSFSASAGSPSIALSGSGVAPTHSVTLEWTESSSGVTGYNVYRASASGGPYTKLTSSLDPLLTYTDSTVLGGQSYFYLLTAVSGTTESAYSSEMQAIIPSP